MTDLQKLCDEIIAAGESHKTIPFRPGLLDDLARECKRLSEENAGMRESLKEMIMFETECPSCEEEIEVRSLSARHWQREADTLRAQVAEMRELLGEMSEYLSRSNEECIYSGSKFHHDMVAKLEGK